MFTAKPTENEMALERAIIEAVHQLDSYPASSEEYAHNLDRIERLYAIKNNRSNRVSPDTLAVVAGNILVALVVVEFERAGMITSKALQFLGKAAR